MEIGCCSLKLSKIKSLATLFDASVSCLNTYINKQYDCYIGWGYSSSSQKTFSYAKKYNKPFIYLEDGFIRSPFVSAISKIPYSFVKDTKAPYYNAFIVTDLETLICQKRLTDTEKKISQQAINYFVHHNLGKFSITNDKGDKALPEGFSEDSILLIDQVQGDLSLEYGAVSRETPQQAYDYIKNNFPNKKIYLKLHPEVLAGKKQGCFDFIHNNPDVLCITDCDIQTLLSYKPRVFVLTSLAGFEALLYSCQVITFGLPWYAGYGLTNDCHDNADILAKRRQKADLQTLFYTAYIDYTHYIEPVTCQKIDIFTMMQLCARVKKHVFMMQGSILALGVRPWKKKDFYPWVKTPYNTVSYCDSAQEVQSFCQKNPDADYKIVVWGYKNSDIIKEIKVHNPNVKIIRIEDGFIRSYGLGSDFFPPLSLCFDTQELYFYKANERKSDFHRAVSQAPFSKIQQKRAEDLKQLIIDERISKYNIEARSKLYVPSDKHIIFVVGQVAGDASLQYGNLPVHLQDDYGLLKQVKKDYPQSYILYKPHPDVTLGNRKQGDNHSKCIDLCDKIVKNTSVIDCIFVSDLTITLTSQVGFDALIRGGRVHCYGQSFYRNYGLCINDNDNYYHNIAMHDFIYAVLLDYPIYQYKGNFITPEIAINIILEQKNQKRDIYRSIIISSKILRYLYKIKKWIIG